MEAKRVIGPLKKEEIPFKNYIVSPLGLIEKKGTVAGQRMIYHLSYPKEGGTSVNANIAPWRCSVRFKEIDTAVRQALQYPEGPVFFSSSDFHQAFRGVPLAKHCWNYLLMNAKDPETGEIFFFIEKALPFSLSIAPKIFQDFSDSIAFLVGAITKSDEPVNYIDDFLNVKGTAQSSDFGPSDLLRGVQKN